ncbi:response regulator [Telluribacter sp.]|jgi:CheY-like chemotaxis protein|uniref:response regulator n=1 Tax=Telluribacter sp. TaxID=1978767 RepID=UPI002E10042C|nr:response regulator [Telluribacter sp.]
MKVRSTFLLIDDELEEHLLFSMALQDINSSYACRCFSNVENAIDYLLQSGTLLPKLIFLDLHLVGTDGRESLKMLKELEGTSHIPVIVYTTSPNPEDVIETRLLGSAGYIVKPGAYANLKEILQKIIKYSDQQVVHFFHKRAPHYRQLLELALSVN